MLKNLKELNKHATKIYIPQPKYFNYFKDNFKEKKANVSVIEEADIIIFAEKHNAISTLKKLWLINHLGKANDAVLLELAHERVKKGKNDTHLFPELTILMEKLAISG